MPRIACLAWTLAALCVVPGAAAQTPGASVSVSDAHAGAKPVAYTVSFATELQCGRLVGHAVVLRFPAAVRLPASVRPAAVVLTGARVRDVAVAGHTLTIAPMPPSGILCDSLVEGTARVVLTAAAGIGNPRARGSYSLSVTRSGDTQTARLRIES